VVNSFERRTAIMSLNACLNIADLRLAAKRRAHKMVFDYIDGGADDERTLARNAGDFAAYDLVHRVLTGVDDIDTSTSLLGMDLAVPFFCGPSAGNRLFHTQGEVAVAKAASHIGTACSLSTLSSVSIEAHARAAPGPKIFQLYVWKDHGLVKEMLARAQAAGYDAMMLTVDLPVHGNRERDLRNGFSVPPVIGAKQVVEALKSPMWTWDYVIGPRIEYANLDTHGPAMRLVDFISAQFDPGFTWKDAQAYREMWDGPAFMKGIVHPSDALKAMDVGYNSIVVSNHGGRQLDSDISPIRALPDILAAVKGQVPVVLDGGVRRGTDILKALALGANAVSFARPYLYGLAAGGEAGALRALTLIKEDLQRGMALLGVTKISDIQPSHVRLRSATRQGSAV
jgi:L-lactate dehydrogenase (cytochrome)